MSGRLVRAVLWGALIGALVIGLGGRVAMRLLALIAGMPPAFSMGGTLEVMAYAAMPGAAGGLVALALRRFRPAISGPLLGAALFALTVLTLPGHLAEAAEGFRVYRPAMIALFGLPFLLAGWLIVRSAPRQAAGLQL